MTMAERFKTARKAKGLSQRQASQMTGLSRWAIMSLESGATNYPLFYTVDKLAELYDVDLIWLMKGERE